MTDEVAELIELSLNRSVPGDCRTPAKAALAARASPHAGWSACESLNPLQTRGAVFGFLTTTVAVSPLWARRPIRVNVEKNRVTDKLVQEFVRIRASQEEDREARRRRGGKGTGQGSAIARREAARRVRFSSRPVLIHHLCWPPVLRISDRPVCASLP